MISERTLKKWRKESLRGDLLDSKIKNEDDIVICMEVCIAELHERVLRLTQELLDQHLMRRK